MQICFWSHTCQSRLTLKSVAFFLGACRKFQDAHKARVDALEGTLNGRMMFTGSADGLVLSHDLRMKVRGPAPAGGMRQAARPHSLTQACPARRMVLSPSSRVNLSVLTEQDLRLAWTCC